MAVSLTKGQAIDLSKSRPGLRRVTMGLGWDAAKPKGLVARFFGGSSDSIDLDASCIVLDAQKRAVDTVWFRRLQSSNGAVRHTGDNLTGDGDGDDEQIVVDLERLPVDAVSLVFTVNSFRGQSFDEVDNAYCRLVDESDVEICRYTLSGRGSHTGVVMAVVTKVDGAWTMRAVGEVADGRTVQDLVPAAIRHS